MTFFHKAKLPGRDDVGECCLKAVGDDFGEDFPIAVQERDWSPVFQVLRIAIGFGYENECSFVEVPLMCWGYARRS